MSEDEGQPIVNAVDGVSLEIEKGEFVALLGHNGCGKSTVAKHLNAMLVPDKGKVFVDGDDTADEEKLLIFVKGRSCTAKSRQSACSKRC